MTLYIEESGTKGAPTIVFLHGMGVSGWMWTTQVNALQDFHCLNIDLPGNGKSNQHEWVSLSDTANEIAEIIRTRATGQKAHVVGLSLGAYVTLTLLDRHASLIESAMMSGVTTLPLPNRGMMSLQLGLMSIFLKTRLLMNMNIRMMQLPSEVIPAYKESFFALSRRSFKQFVNEALDFTMPDGLKSVTVRTLSVAGDLEQATIKQSVGDVVATMPNAEGYFIPKVHHGWPGEAPELCTAIVLAWVQNQPLPDELVPVNPSPLSVATA